MGFALLVVVSAFIVMVTAVVCTATYTHGWIEVEKIRTEAMLRKAREDRGE